jgi:hypothetical protein
MNLFMVQVDYRLRYRLMHGSGYLVQFDWYRIYNSIFHSNSVIVVLSLYLYIREFGRGKDRWF